MMNNETRAIWETDIENTGLFLQQRLGTRKFLEVNSSKSLPVLRELAAAYRNDTAGNTVLMTVPDVEAYLPHYIFRSLLCMTQSQMATYVFGSIIDAQPMTARKYRVLAPYVIAPTTVPAFASLVQDLVNAYGTVAGIDARADSKQKAASLARVEAAPADVWARLLSIGMLYADPTQPRPRFGMILNNTTEYMDPPLYVLGMLCTEAYGATLHVKPPPLLNFMTETRDGNRYAQNLLRMYKAVVLANDLRLLGKLPADTTPRYAPRYSNSSADTMKKTALILGGGAVTLPMAGTLGAVVAGANVVFMGAVATVLAPIAGAVYYGGTWIAAKFGTDVALEAIEEKAEEKIQDEIKQEITDSITESLTPDRPKVVSVPVPVAAGAVPVVKPAISGKAILGTILAALTLLS